VTGSTTEAAAATKET